MQFLSSSQLEVSAVNQRKGSKPEQNLIASEKMGNNAKKIYVEQRKHSTIQRRHTQCSRVIKESLPEIQPCD